MTSAARFAAATWVGAVLVGFLHVVAVELYGSPDPFDVRIARDGFHVVSSAGLGALIAAVPALYGRFVPARYAGVFWVLVAAGAMLAARLLLVDTIERLAVVLAFQFGIEADGGANTRVFEGLILALAGLLLVGAWLVGDWAGRRRWGSTCVILGVVAFLLAQPHLHRDDRDELHVLATWIAATALGAAVVPTLPHHWWSSRVTVAIAALAAMLTLVWSPSNAVRLALFRDPGAAPAWVLAQRVWGAIEGDEEAASVAVVQPVTSAPPPAVAAPVVVLLTVDAMRADVLATRHYDEQLPTLARLRDQGVYVPRAVAPSAQTAVSLTSLFTGRYYSSLRWVRHGTGWFRSTYPLHDPSPRFPELLSAANVRTASLLSPGFIAGRSGIARGFTHETIVSQDHAPGPVTSISLLRELSAVGATEPAFIYAHLMDAHEPYDRGALRTGPAFERYVSELAIVDRQIGYVLDLLRTRFADRGYLVITADHGEAFDEHGRRFHSSTVYDEMIAVPLVLWGPGITPRVLLERVSLIDIAPTVLALFSVPPAPTMEGESLLAPARRARSVGAETRLKRALITPDGLKVIEDLRRKTVEVYDLDADPGEHVNLWEDAADRARMRRSLATARAFFRARANPTPGYEPPYRR